MFATSLGACKKEKDGASTTPPPTVDTTVAIEPAVDPPLASTIGFFMNDWQAKNFTAPSYTETPVPAGNGTTITVNPSSIITKIPSTLFGNNANPYMTQIVTEAVLLNHIKNLHPKIIRFPGGNLSSVFFWNAPKGERPADAPATLLDADGKTIDGGYWYGKNTEGWTLSTDNYYQMLQQTGNEGMITVNYAYARYSTAANPVASAAHLAADWVRYDNGRTKYWEIGNESNGTWQAGHRIKVSDNKDGQPEIITGELYGKHFKIFADSMRKAAQEIGKTIYIGAQLLEKQAESWQTATDKNWNAGVYTHAGNTPGYYIIHSYYTPYNTNSNAADILASAPKVTKDMMDYVRSNSQAAGVSSKPLAMTEWNIFATGSMQMVSHISGLHAVMVLGELMKNKYGMASRWDLANSWDDGNDHGLFNSGNEPNSDKWNPRPAFYHMYFFQKFLGDRFITSSVANNANLETYASSFSSGQVGIAIVNKGTSAQDVRLNIQNFRIGNRFYWYTLSGGNDNGEFSRKVFVNNQGPGSVSGGPANYTSIKAFSATTANGVKVNVPARSVVHLVVDKK
jgi:hypothetical protein